MQKWWPEREKKTEAEAPVPSETEGAKEAGNPGRRRRAGLTSIGIAVGVGALTLGEMAFLHHLATSPGRGRAGVSLTADGRDPVELPALIGIAWAGQASPVSTAEREILPACRRLGAGFVGYSPLGRGLLGGTIRKPGDLTPDDWRLQSPRYQGDNLAHNVALVEQVEAFARAKGCTSAQVAIAWALAQGRDIVPIPGTKRIKYLEQNLAALNITLTPADLAALDAVTPAGSAVAGDRYQPAMMGYLNG